MPAKKYALEPGGRQRLVLCWRGSWKCLTVWLDGQEVGTLPDQRALRAGQSFFLDDGSNLHVQLVQNFLTPELRLVRNGRPLPGSPSDPAERLHVAYAALFLVAGWHLAIGILAELYGSDALARLGIGGSCLAVGMLFLVLGLMVRRRSTRALFAAMVLYGLEALASVMVAASRGGGISAGGLLVLFFFMAGMYRGFAAIGDLNREGVQADASTTMDTSGTRPYPGTARRRIRRGRPW